MNTSLFNHVKVAAKDFDGNRVNILVAVKERWYLFPVPVFRPVDRNLNQWLVEQKGSLDRVNYGAKFPKPAMALGYYLPEPGLVYFQLHNRPGRCP